MLKLQSIITTVRCENDALPGAPGTGSPPHYITVNRKQTGLLIFKSLLQTTNTGVELVSGICNFNAVLGVKAKFSNLDVNKYSSIVSKAYQLS